MYLSVDLGGTKTLLAVFDENGVLVDKHKFPTDHNYNKYIKSLLGEIEKVWTPEIKAVGVAVPARINRKNNTAVSFGNLEWKNVDIAGEISSKFGVKAYIDNDANLAGLAEAHTSTAQKFNRVLYLTISTGIGTGFIVGGEISPLLADSEGGHIVFEHNGKPMDWEDFASGRAIRETYGKYAYEIEDEKTWEEIAHSLSIGFQHLIAVLQPELLVVGGSIGTHFDKFSRYLNDDLNQMVKKFSDDLFELPKIIQAEHPQQAVVYGCYLLAKSKQDND